MEYTNNLFNQTRREFLKGITAAGSVVVFGTGNLFALSKTKKKWRHLPDDFQYKYRTVSVKHVEEVKKWFDKLNEEKKIGTIERFRKYMGTFNFNPEEIMPGAKSLIIISLPFKTASVLFNYKSKKIEILIPSGYSRPEFALNVPSITNLIMNDIIKDSNKKIQFTGATLPLKTFAVRSGLADYGKNNITFVEEYGSFHRFAGLYTDKELEDNWRPLQMLRICKGCSICINECPTKCIREENFIINADKCISIYNEEPGQFPDWMPKEVHHTLVGCLKCQYTCPANDSIIKDIDKLAEISEDETEFLLSDKTDKEIYSKISKKLARFPSVRNFDDFRRNFKMAFANIFPKS
ncbi:4Fe-4S double cluster binding domain-containing protein [candidate division KSB1 bacterium]